MPDMIGALKKSGLVSKRKAAIGRNLLEQEKRLTEARMRAIKKGQEEKAERIGEKLMPLRDRIFNLENLD